MIQLNEVGKPVESIWGEGYQGYGNSFTNKTKTEIILPRHHKKSNRINEQYINLNDLIVQSNKTEELVPIRLEFDIEKDKFKLTDTFLWNLNEKIFSLEKLVSIFGEDFKFKNPLHQEIILSSIKEQLNDYHPMIYPRKPNSISKKISDLRIPIKLDITIGNNQLLDQFEWDVNNIENDPEEFSKVLCEEMSLPGEFITAISHSIREQIQISVKSLYLIGYKFDGSSVEGGEEVKNYLKSNIDVATIRF
ncbi:unnamed protein product [[Candida] boidinii]|nr:unnamed protein product [[Candida] boidinii]